MISAHDLHKMNPINSPASTREGHTKCSTAELFGKWWLLGGGNSSFSSGMFPLVGYPWQYRHHWLFSLYYLSFWLLLLFIKPGNIKLRREYVGRQTEFKVKGMDVIRIHCICYLNSQRKNKIHVLKNFRNYHDRETVSDVSRDRSYSVTDIGFVSKFYTWL